MCAKKKEILSSYFFFWITVLKRVHDGMWTIFLILIINYFFLYPTKCAMRYVFFPTLFVPHLKRVAIKWNHRFIWQCTTEILEIVSLHYSVCVSVCVTDDGERWKRHTKSNHYPSNSVIPKSDEYCWYLNKTFYLYITLY